MFLLATQAEAQMLEHEHPCLGRLVQPRQFRGIALTVARGVEWAADNDAFNGWSVEAAAAFEEMLDAIEGLPGCRFVTSPDVVGEAGLTDLLYEEWAPRIMARGLPAAYVVQEDGCEYEPRFPGWGCVDALFIGCATDEEKLGPRVREFVAEAKRRGKWVHMGRVNSKRRMDYARAIGCDSVDGTKWVKWRKTHMENGLRFVSGAPRPAPGQRAMELAA